MSHSRSWGPRFLGRPPSRQPRCPGGPLNMSPESEQPCKPGPALHLARLSSRVSLACLGHRVPRVRWVSGLSAACLRAAATQCSQPWEDRVCTVSTPSALRKDRGGPGPAWQWGRGSREKAAHGRGESEGLPRSPEAYDSRGAAGQRWGPGFEPDQQGGTLLPPLTSSVPCCASVSHL